MKSILVILRRVYLELVDGNHCAAKLIEYFKHWREWKIKHHRTEWVYMPVRQIYEDLMGEHSVGIIRRAIALLVKLGLLEQRHNPGNGQDRTWQYRLNQQVLDSRVNENPEVKTETPSVKSDQCINTQDPSSIIKSTERGDVESFPQAEEVIEKYEPQLKTYGIYRISYSGDVLGSNPKMQPILAVLSKIPRPRAERAIEAFLRWIRDARNVEDKYKALEIAISRRWN